MPRLADYEAPPDAVAHRGVVVAAPAKLGDPFTVQVPDFDDLHVSQIRRYEYRGATLPAAGDECLVVIDDNSEPWVVAWWPAAGDEAGSTANAKGFVAHGEDSGVARPGGFPSVEWNGIVEPLNAIDTDTWVNPGKP